MRIYEFATIEIANIQIYESTNLQFNEFTKRKSTTANELRPELSGNPFFLEAATSSPPPKKKIGSGTRKLAPKKKIKNNWFFGFEVY